MVSTLMRQLSLASDGEGTAIRAGVNSATISIASDLNRVGFTFHVRVFVVPENRLSRFGSFKNHNR